MVYVSWHFSLWWKLYNGWIIKVKMLRSNVVVSRRKRYCVKPKYDCKYTQLENYSIIEERSGKVIQKRPIM